MAGLLIPLAAPADVVDEVRRLLASSMGKPPDPDMSWKLGFIFSYSYDEADFKKRAVLETAFAAASEDERVYEVVITPARSVRHTAPFVPRRSGLYLIARDDDDLRARVFTVRVMLS